MMTTNENVALWGCIVCSQVAIQGGWLIYDVFAALWLTFAGLIIWGARRNRKESHRDAGPDAG